MNLGKSEKRSGSKLKTIIILFVKINYIKEHVNQQNQLGLETTKKK